MPAKAPVVFAYKNPLEQDFETGFGCGFHKSNHYQFRRSYLTYSGIFQTPSGKLKTGRASAKGQRRVPFKLLRTTSVYVFSVQAKVWGAHASSVPVFAFCEDELFAGHGDPRWGRLKGSLFRQNASTSTPGGVRSPEMLPTAPLNTSTSRYARLPSINTDFARKFQDPEAVRSGWSLRQLGRRSQTSLRSRARLEARNRKRHL